MGESMSSSAEIRWSVYALEGLTKKQREEFEYSVDEAIYGRHPTTSIIRRVIVSSWDSREAVHLSPIKSLNQYNFDALINILQVRYFGHFDDLIENSNQVFSLIHTKR